MENRQWQKLAEKKSRHRQKSHEMYSNVIAYSFNCLSWSILTQRDEKYGYSVIDSRWCVRVLFLFMTYICSFIVTFMAHSSPYISVNCMMILVLASKNGFKWPTGKYLCLWHIDVGPHTFIFLFTLCSLVLAAFLY